MPVHYEEYGVMKSPLSAFVDEVRRRTPPGAVTCLERGESLALPSQRAGA
ncbi:hypothetical protein ACFQV2_31310 [Actinokineospora soli]|uniref:Uncharacterized protein n=1 Tax=Actinokineospora soli TaxID=1048753 RepID=A0ABW2TU48_9PSEU